MEFIYTVYELTESPAIASYRQYDRREAIASGVMLTFKDAQHEADVWFEKNPNKLEVEVVGMGDAFYKRKTPISKCWITIPRVR